MALFDEMDARTAEAVGRLLNERVIWRPMVLPTGGTYVQTSGESDPLRPVRGESPSDPLFAIVTWALAASAVGTAPSGGVVGTATLLVDFEDAYFDPDIGKPLKGDRFDLPDQDDPANRVVEVQRVNSDGSARVLCWCTVIRE